MSTRLYEVVTPLRNGGPGPVPPGETVPLDEVEGDDLVILGALKHVSGEAAAKAEREAAEAAEREAAEKAAAEAAEHEAAEKAAAEAAEREAAKKAAAEAAALSKHSKAKLLEIADAEKAPVESDDNKAELVRKILAGRARS